MNNFNMALDLLAPTPSALTFLVVYHCHYVSVKNLIFHSNWHGRFSTLADLAGKVLYSE